ncbi:MAG TPA: right-handed parallel beta-helix repeat-containing protein [Planctomycetota bacterium]|nr:right-handed parallel beta-helix repeat-containing protein [Planctomycetota bacterium]
MTTIEERNHSRRRKPAWWRRVTLRDVVFFTLPPIALALWVLGSSVLDYGRIRQFDDWWSNATSVRKFGWQRLHTALVTPRAVELENRLSADDPRVEALRILTDRIAWQDVERDVGASFGEWIEADLARGNDLHPVRIRFRGDGSVHWTAEKKSLTVRTSRDRLFKGFRTLIFSVKDVLPQYLANSLARDFGLLGPDTEVVPAYMNDRFYGVFRFVEPVDESFLRRHGRLPGNVFRGDTAERGEYFKGVERELFKNPHIWDRVAVNDRPGAIGIAGLGEWLTDLNGTTFEDHERWMARMDRAELSRLFALLLACGDPYHMSGVHNQFWYEDPATALLHPVVWDLRLLELGVPRPNVNLNRFWRAALRDPRVFDGALVEIEPWLEGGRLMALARERLERVEGRHRDALELDRLRAGIISPVGEVEECLETLRASLGVLATWLQDARVDFCASAASNGERVLDLVSRGRAGAELLGLEGLGAGAQVWADSDLDGAHGPADRRVELLADGRLAEPEVLLPGCAGSGSEIVAEPIHYRYFVAGAEASRLQPRLARRFGGQPIEASPWAAGEPIPATRSWHPWRFADPEPTERRLAGEVHLASDLRVARGETLVIEPGARIALDPDVSILVLGRLSARGTAERPIVIANAVEGLPFGTLALQGAHESVLEHVHVRGGGGALLERVEYTGQVCVHASRDVRIERCVFGPNLRCDDSLHVDLCSGALVADSLFHDANADAIDFDVSDGEIRGCTIERSGNDGIDLMSCSPRILACRIMGSGDKGISVGENSSPVIAGCEIQGCERGLEVKDLSRPILLRTAVTENRVGLAQHAKNWRYGGPGWARLASSIVAGNGEDYAADEDARLTIVGPGEPFRILPAGTLASGQGSTPEEGDGWIAREVGLELDGFGESLRWNPREPAQRLAGGSFVEDFGEPTDGWMAGSTVRRLGKRRGGLIADIEGHAGRIGLLERWDLQDPALVYVLVLEVAGSDLASVEASVSSSDGVRRAPVWIDADPLVYRCTEIELPPGRYDSLSIEARTRAGSGRLALHSWRLLAWPREERQ